METINNKILLILFNSSLTCQQIRKVELTSLRYSLIWFPVSISCVSQNSRIFSPPAKRKFPSFSRKITRDIDSVNGREIFIENSTNEYFIFLPFSVCLSVRIIFHALPTLQILFFQRLVITITHQPYERRVLRSRCFA